MPYGLRLFLSIFSIINGITMKSNITYTCSPSGAVRRCLLLAGLSLSLLAHGQADPNRNRPLNEDPIVIGQSADMSGDYVNLTHEFLSGANVYFSRLNASGGIRGRTVRLLTLDDKGDPELAVKNTQQLLQMHKALMLFGYSSARTNSAVLQTVTEQKIPYFAPLTGTEFLYRPFNRFIFTIRASYAEEYRYLFPRLARMGMPRVAIYNSIPGLPHLVAMQTMAQDANIELDIFETGIGLDNDTVASKLIDVKPHIIMFMSTDFRVNGELMKSLRSKGYLGYFYCASLVCSPLVTRNLEEVSRGLITSQVVPPPWKTSIPIVREYQQAMLAAGINDFSYLGLEGYIAARVLTEGLKRAGPDINRESVIAALESINENNYEIPGYRINFSASDHSGSHFVDMTSVNKQGIILH